MIVRNQIEYAQKRLFKGKALIIFGPRQAGKTVFAEQLLKTTIDKKIIRLNGDDADVRELFKKANKEKIKRIIGDNEILLIDEAQRIHEIGISIKIIVDQIREVQVIATGSSAFELAGKINEPLTGRKYEVQLFPLSFAELVNYQGLLSEKRMLEQRLIYGSYPEIIVNPNEAKEHIKLIANSYLYKDLLSVGQITKPALLEKIVKALALQVGSEVNYNELSQLVGADNKTIEKYIDLLEKAFVLFKLPAFTGNVRNEIKKGKKIYFVDNGIINAITNNFNPLHNRRDTGALWENYIISERRKYINQQRIESSYWFWRTTQQQEIDYVETDNNNIKAIEIKWNPKAKARFPDTFTKAYENVSTSIITPENFEDFLM